MFYLESRWIVESLSPLARDIQRAIDVGAGGDRYASRPQNQAVYSFLAQYHIALSTLDNDQKSTCDYHHDIAEELDLPSLMPTFDLVLCTSVLEHVTDIPRAKRNLVSLVGPNGYLVVTVPNRYPRHRKPIDNGYRPTAGDLELLFPELSVVRSETIEPKRDKWFHWCIFPPGISTPKVTCALFKRSSEAKPRRNDILPKLAGGTKPFRLQPNPSPARLNGAFPDKRSTKS